MTSFDTIDTTTPGRVDREQLYQIATAGPDVATRLAAVDAVAEYPGDRSIVTLAEIAAQSAETTKDEIVREYAVALLAEHDTDPSSATHNHSSR